MNERKPVILDSHGVLNVRGVRLKLLVLLFFFLFAGSSIGYAVWDERQMHFEDIDIIIGEGAQLSVVSVVEDPDATTRLVPLGAFRGRNDIDHYIYEYTVAFNKEGYLLIGAYDLTVGDVENPFSLFNVAIAIEGEGFEAATDTLLIELEEDGPFYDSDNGFHLVTVQVKVFMDVPADEQQYESVKQGRLSFSLSFEAIEKDGLQED